MNQMTRRTITSFLWQHRLIQTPCRSSIQLINSSNYALNTVKPDGPSVCPDHGVFTRWVPLAGSYPKSRHSNREYFCQSDPVRPAEDLDAYPRDEDGDLKTRKANVDIVFLPTSAEIYQEDGETHYTTGRGITTPRAHG